jgi:hypothetical protein
MQRVLLATRKAQGGFLGHGVCVSDGQKMDGWQRGRMMASPSSTAATAASMDVAPLQVVVRVLGTLLGACLGLAINSTPGVFSNPAALLLSLGIASAPLALAAHASARKTASLALMTLMAVSLCSYEAACCSAQKTAARLSHNEVFAQRTISV